MLNSVVALLLVAGIALVSAGPIAKDHKAERIELVARNGNNGRIIGGETAQPGQFPFQVSLYDIEYFHFCNGAIIASRWVLTTMRCTPTFFVANPEYVHVVTAVTDRENSGVHYVVEQVVQHENFDNFTLENDIALHRTVLPIVFNAQVAIIPFSSNVIGAGVQARASGWGYTTLEGPDAQHLQFLDVVTLTNIDCRSRHSGLSQFVVDGNLCVMPLQRGTGMCVGDTGAPLVSDGQLIALDSWGESCAIGRPDAFVRVSHYFDWITQNMQANE